MNFATQSARSQTLSVEWQLPLLKPMSEIITLSDVNTAEASGRIPGIFLETDSGEGRFVSIR